MSDVAQSAEHAADGPHGGAHSGAAHADPVGAKIGMWLFLFTEVMLFGAVFIVFAVYLHTYTDDFMAGSADLNKAIGSANTAVLLTSSLTVVLSVGAVARGQTKRALGLLGATVGAAGLFVVFKAIEWGSKLSHGVYPGSPSMVQRPVGEQVFYGLYFSMTGLHALHVIIGGAAIAVTMVAVAKGKVNQEHPTLVENVGLYWHLVDVVWIYLFPMFYLIG